MEAIVVSECDGTLIVLVENRGLCRLLTNLGQQFDGAT